jgi:hypothetical protein
MAGWIAPSSREEGNAEANFWSLRIERSTDQGKSWFVSAHRQPHAYRGDPAQHPLPPGRSPGTDRADAARVPAQSWSRDNGVTWSPIAAIDLPNPNAGTDAVTLADGRQLIVYNHSAHAPDTPGDGPRWPINIGLSDDGCAGTMR